jgi:trimethylamine:corrinoid methyltransferase-like protein
MLDLIDEIGSRGSFIATPQTARRCREEIYTSDLIDRNAWATWHENGALTMLERVQKKLADILSHPPPIQLSRDTHDRISAIVQAAEQRESIFRFENTG